MTAHAKTPTHAGKPKHAPKPVTVQITVRNKLLHSDKLDGAKIEITGGTPPVSVSATTNRSGSATVDLNALPDGTYNLRVTPTDTSSADVGPQTASMASPPARIFRTLNVTITVKAGTIPSASIPAADVRNGSVETPAHPTHLTINVQPVWIASPFHSARTGTARQVVNLLIVHHTGDRSIGSTLNEFLHSSRQVSAGYVIDVDGQIVKMVQDDRAAHQAGFSFWDGVDGVNGTSIGIEIVNATPNAYPDEQYVALIGLLRKLTAEVIVEPRRIVGHSDVATDKHGRHVLGRKSTDPGVEFEWTRLEAVSLGMVPGAAALAATAYGGFFTTFTGGDLRRGDNDDRHHFGGKTQRTFTGRPVQEVQEDLKAIGYSIGTPDGDFGARTDGAVQMFQEHFFGGTRKGGRLDGRVDKATAEMIKRVRP
jgi:N-acetylmuramoyl-L-alanine amidase